MDQVSLARFVAAQDGQANRGEDYITALREMRQGSKSSCWVWYVFPQFLDRGGEMNMYYQIHHPGEAVAYLQHEVLGERYLEISAAVLAALGAGEGVEHVMGWEVDAKKLHQSVTLFHLAAQAAEMQEATQLLSDLLDAIWERPYIGQASREDPMTVTRWAAES